MGGLNYRPIWGYSLVGVQFALFGLLGFSEPVFSDNIIFLCFEILAVAIALLAFVSIKFGFNVVPQPKMGAPMVSKGIYAYIRHPMYASLLLYFGSHVADHFSLLRLFYLLVLLTVFLFKMYFEEKMLSQKFEGYVAYKQKTKRLIPFVY